MTAKRAAKKKPAARKKAAKPKPAARKKAAKPKPAARKKAGGSKAKSRVSKKETTKKPAAKKTAKKTAKKASGKKKTPARSSTTTGKAKKKTVSKTKTVAKVSKKKTAKSKRPAPAGSRATVSSRKKKRPRRPPLDLDAFRRQLGQRHAELLEAYMAAKGDSRSRESDGTEDYIDYAVSSYDREFLLSLTELEQNQLRLIEEAIQRIDKGGFGLCVQCERPIRVKRLEVQPWARYCLRCQEMADKGLVEDAADFPDDDDDVDIDDDVEEELEVGEGEPASAR